MTAWIAHGLLDSVVDSFFPFLAEIEKEVLTVEDLVFSYGTRTSDSQETLVNAETRLDFLARPKEYVIKEKGIISAGDTLHSEKGTKSSADRPALTRFSLPRPPLLLVIKRFRRLLEAKLFQNRAHDETTINPRRLNLRRMTRVRRLVTTLTRLLALKSDIILGVQKRFAGIHASAKGGDIRSEAADIAMHFGDIHGTPPRPKPYLRA